MDKKYFYVKSYLDDSIYQIHIDDINALALFSITLDPEKEMSEAEKYASALKKYCENSNNGLSKSFSKLVDNAQGKAFLLTTINLFLIEKQFRQKGISDIKLIERYNRIVTEYNKQIEFNNNKFANQNKTYYKKL